MGNERSDEIIIFFFLILLTLDILCDKIQNQFLFLLAIDGEEVHATLHTGSTKVTPLPVRPGLTDDVTGRKLGANCYGIFGAF